MMISVKNAAYVVAATVISVLWLHLSSAKLWGWLMRPRQLPDLVPNITMATNASEAIPPLLITSKPSGLRDFEHVLRPTLDEAPASHVTELGLDDDKLSLLAHGRWLLFIYAEWCPHSRSSMQVWRETIQGLRESGIRHASLPTFAAANLAQNHRLASAVQLSKLPAFVLVQDGFILGSSISSPSSEDLVKYCSSDWSVFESRRPLRVRADLFSPYDMVIYSWLGRTLFSIQEAGARWIHEHKMLAASSLLILVLVGASCRRFGYL